MLPISQLHIPEIHASEDGNDNENENENDNDSDSVKYILEMWAIVSHGRYESRVY